MKNQLIKILGLSDLAGWGIVESLLPMLYGSIIHLILNMQKSNKTPLMGVSVCRQTRFQPETETVFFHEMEYFLK